MSGKAYGLNIMKKPSIGSRPPPAKRKPIFDEEDGSEDDKTNDNVETIGEFGGITGPPSISKSKTGPPRSGIAAKPNALSAAKKTNPNIYGDLSANFTSKKHAETAEELDASIYDYDAVYDSLKPQKKQTEEDKERKPKYMGNLMAAAALRKRDQTIAEEKKVAREREAEGDEFADKEKFVTSAYKKQQEENRRLEEEEKVREAEQEKKNNKMGGGMVGFMKSVLDKEEQRHAEIVRAAEERARAGPLASEEAVDDGKNDEAELAKKINEKHAGAIAVNDEGQVVDKRQLLKGGLNIAPKVKSGAASAAPKASSSGTDGNRNAFVGAGGSKQAMRERQTRMLEAQLEQATKRALEAEEETTEKVERAAKSRKTDGEIMGAKERYLARKREAEEAKKKAEA